MGLENLQYGFRRASDARLLSMNDNRTLNQARMPAHGFEQLRVFEVGIVQAEFPVFDFALAQQISRPDAEQADNVLKFGNARRLLEILDRVRLEAVLTEQGQRLATLGAEWTMVNGECHRKENR